MGFEVFVLKFLLGNSFIECFLSIVDRTAYIYDNYNKSFNLLDLTTKNPLKTRYKRSKYVPLTIL